MPAEVRCTSSGALSTEGNAKPKTRIAVVTKPKTPDQNTIQAPLAAVMIPTRLISESAPAATYAQGCFTNRPATASMISEAGSWQTFSAVSALEIRSGRPAAVTKSGRKALVTKYIALTLPRIAPSRQISGRRQSGHHARLATAAPFVPCGRGAQAMIKNAVAKAGIDQTTKLRRQLLSTSGNTSGIVSATAMVSPARSPLV